ncbi:MAG TPA: lysophospholipid acyltransferase family protein [Opitutaceae bacterium]|nr:lysophospholipid acyltransferase family protein [Opitutaceae bacterium]
MPINEVRGWRRALLWGLAAVLRAWNRTLRFDVDAATRAVLEKSDQPVALVLWHNRLFVSGEYFRRFRHRRPVAALVSASKDGAWLAAFYRLVGIEPVRGSSSNHGREAARVLIEKMRGGYDLGITPDGPRGPLYTVEPGVLVVSRRVEAPLVLLGIEFTRAWRLRSWDRFYIPWPFSRVRWRATLLPSRGADGAKLDAESVRAALLAINPDR